jgi:hypothetical protein
MRREGSEGDDHCNGSQVVGHAQRQCLPHARNTPFNRLAGYSRRQTRAVHILFHLSSG